MFNSEDLSPEQMDLFFQKIMKMLSPSSSHYFSILVASYYIFCIFFKLKTTFLAQKSPKGVKKSTNKFWTISPTSGHVAHWVKFAVKID